MVLLVLQSPLIAYCGSKVALTNGNWADGSRWSTGLPPDCGDTLLIPSGRTITVNDQEDYDGCANRIIINVSGNLNFSTGKKINFPCGSYVILNMGGRMNPGSGGGNSNLINICGLTVWQSADGVVDGPTVFPNNAVPLPIQIVDFSVKRTIGNEVIIKWSTASEVNNDYFEILRSSDSLNFEGIGTVPGNANSNVLRNYEFLDAPEIASVSSTYYYRLDQIDFDGHRKTVGITSIKISLQEFTMFPVPVRKASKLHLTLPQEGICKVSISDCFGKIIFYQEYTSNSCCMQIDFTIPETLQGIYTLISTSEQGSLRKKLIITD